MKFTEKDLLNEMMIDDIQSEHMRAIAESCGIKDAVSLMKRVPGTVIWVPKTPTAITNKFISENPSMKVVAKYCGYGIAARLIINRKSLISTQFYVPKNGFDLTIKNTILKQFNGDNATELALKFGVSVRYIQKIAAEMYAARLQTKRQPKVRQQEIDTTIKG